MLFRLWRHSRGTALQGRSASRAWTPRPRQRPAGHKLILEQLEERCAPSVDPILEWNANAIEVNRVSYSGNVVNDEIGPTRSSRALAIEHVAMFDAWNS